MLAKKQKSPEISLYNLGVKDVNDRCSIRTWYHNQKIPMGGEAMVVCHYIPSDIDNVLKAGQTVLKEVPNEYVLHRESYLEILDYKMMNDISYYQQGTQYVNDNQYFFFLSSEINRC